MNDDVVVLLADYLSKCTSETAPSEIHLSDCAIGVDGFNALISGIEESDAFPTKGRNDRCLPLYLRIENNYIDEQAIQAKVAEGVLATFSKRTDEKKSYPPEVKVKLLVFDEDKGKGRGKDRDERDKGTGKGKGKGKDKDREKERDSYRNWMGRESKEPKGKGKASRSPIAPWAAPPAPARTTRPRERDDAWGSGGGSGGGARNAASTLARRPRTPPRGAVGASRPAARAPSARESAKGPGRAAPPASRGLRSPPPARNGSYATRPAAGGRGSGAPPTRPRETSSRDEPPAKRREVFTPRRTADGPSVGGAAFNAFGRSAAPAKGSATGAAGGGGKAAGGKAGKAEKGKGGKSSGKSEKLPPAWEKHYSDEYGIHYFWNSKTGDASWDKPGA